MAQETEPATESHLITAVEQYIAECRVEYPILQKIDTASIKIEVSHKMKRAAGKAIYRSPYVMRLSWNAYQAWGFDDMFKGVIRHELAHFLEDALHGYGGHGPTFMLYASKLNAPRRCSQFTDYTYKLFCQGCDKMVGGRYRRSKIVKYPHRYLTGCCYEEVRVEQ